MSWEYSENILVQGAAGDLLEQELGWRVVFAYNKEKLGANGTLGRTDYREILLKRDFRAALKKLNPWLNDAQITEAEKQMEHRLSTASLMQINEEKYALITESKRFDISEIDFDLLRREFAKTRKKNLVIKDLDQLDQDRMPEHS